MNCETIAPSDTFGFQSSWLIEIQCTADLKRLDQEDFYTPVVPKIGVNVRSTADKNVIVSNVQK
jgi:hypothetical protein